MPPPLLAAVAHSDADVAPRRLRQQLRSRQQRRSGEASGFAGNPLTSDPLRYARNAAIIEADPTVGIGSPTVAWLDAAFDTMVEFRDANYPSQIDQPVLIVAAGADNIVSVAAIKRFAARLPAGSHQVIEGARHEILQEQDGFARSSGRPSMPSYRVRRSRSI